MVRYNNHTAQTIEEEEGWQSPGDCRAQCCQICVENKADVEALEIPVDLRPFLARFVDDEEDTCTDDDDE